MLAVKLTTAPRTGSALARHQVDRRVLASSIDLNVEFKPVAFSKVAHTGAFNRTDMHKRIGLTIITGDEAKALHAVEKLDRTSRLFAGQLALRCFGRFALCHRDHIADNNQIGCGDLAAAIDQGEFKLLPFGQTFKASPLDRTDMDEDIFAAIIALDEAKALLGVEELYDALAFANDLSRHACPAACTAASGAAARAVIGTTAAASAATRAAEATPAAAIAATAKPAAIIKTATSGCSTTSRKGIKPFLAETIPFVAPTATTSSIKTHKTERTFASPHTDPARLRGRIAPDDRASGNKALSAALPLLDHYQPVGESIHFPTCARRGGVTFLPASRCSRSIQPNASLASPGQHWQRSRMEILNLLTDPTAWAALLTLIVLEIVLGIDNLVFIAILSNKLPAHQQAQARRIGLTLALVMRIVLLLLIGWIVTLQQPLFDLGITGAPGPHGEPGFETAFSGRDLILIAGGLFLLWKATKEIHHNLDPEGESGELLDHDKGLAQISFNAAIAQIIALDLVFSVDSILTAVGMTDEVPIMITAVVFTVGVMMLAADPLSRFIEKNPTLVMLALAFLVMIGVVLLADGFGVHIPKGYIYAAMGFSALVETLNIVGRNRRQRKALAAKG